MSIAKKVGVGYVLAVLLTGFLVWTVQHSGTVTPVEATVVSSERWGKYGKCEADSYCRNEYWKTTVRAGEARDRISLYGGRPTDGATVQAFAVRSEDRVVLHDSDPTDPVSTILPTLFIGMIEGLIALFLVLLLEDRAYARRRRA